MSDIDMFLRNLLYAVLWYLYEGSIDVMVFVIFRGVIFVSVKLPTNA